MADEQAEKDFAALQAKMLENNGKMKAVRVGWRAAGQCRSKRAASDHGCADGFAVRIRNGQLISVLRGPPTLIGRGSADERRVA
jgi:hypothetical protein